MRHNVPKLFSFLALEINKLENNSKIYLQKFADIKCLRIFVVLLAMKLKHKN